MSAPAAIPIAVVPTVPLLALDTVWFQVAGTLCNLTCSHCFITCGPTNRRHAMMSRAETRPYLDEARALGVRDFYFTGGEPFLNRELHSILEDALAMAPSTVLTNATLIDAAEASRLRALEQESRYSLEVRVSLDGLDPASNDALRGEGSFAGALTGLRELSRAGFDPIVTVAQTWSDGDDAALRARFHDTLRDVGLARPRVKVLPMFRVGREADRSGGYGSRERLTPEHLLGFDMQKLQCSTSRMVTSRGVYVCPILIDSEDARLGPTLRASLRSFPLAHGACHTCWATGATCRN
jgi:sulfatase maturation enzyme AslB (radical SAM superfamily)